MTSAKLAWTLFETLFRFSRITITRLKSSLLVSGIPCMLLMRLSLGAHVVTLPPDVLGKMINHPLTDIGLAKFLDDWKKVKQSNPKIALTR